MPDNTIDDIETDVGNSATAPANVSVDGNSVSSRSIDDKVKAAGFLEQRQMSSVKQLFGNRTRLIPGPRQ